jgi:hypothetical protein
MTPVTMPIWAAKSWNLAWNMPAGRIAERWLDGDPQIAELIEKLSQIHREDILNSTKICRQESPHAARKL